MLLLVLCGERLALCGISGRPGHTASCILGRDLMPDGLNLLAVMQLRLLVHSFECVAHTGDLQAHQRDQGLRCGIRRGGRAGGPDHHWQGEPPGSQQSASKPDMAVMRRPAGQATNKVRHQH